VPLSEGFAAQHAAMPENHLVHGRIYSAAGSQPKRAVIVVHGFTADGLDSVARFTPAERMAAREIAVVVLSLPYHGLRKPASARFSGELFMSGDVVRTFEAILQAVSDVRATVAWLQDGLGVEKVGLIGGSLGGYVATLTAAVEPRLALLYAIAPPIRITDQIDRVPLGRYMTQGLRAQKFPETDMHRLQDLVDPTRFEPAVPTSRMCFIAGRNDLFVPRIHMQRLIESWQGLQVRWHDWGHLTLILAWPPGRLFDEIQGFADEVGF
jgi:pimeloyl-ACP methyl ester carboxylesterase